MDVRVQDYLEDRLQSLADLSNLDVLLESVNSQHTLLKQQLDDARRDHEAAKTEAESHALSLREKCQTFQKSQSDIDRRLLIVTQSDARDDAVRKFEASMARLHKLDVAAGYVELLKEVDGFQKSFDAEVRKPETGNAFELYDELRRLNEKVVGLQEAAEGAAPHLVDHITRIVAQMREELVAIYEEEFEAVLKNIGWPGSKLQFENAEIRKGWLQCWERFWKLQRPELDKYEEKQRLLRNPSGEDEPPVLLPMAVMVRPLEQRFQYHFSGDKPTNRLDKPEYFLSHITDLVSKYPDMLDQVQSRLTHPRLSQLASVPAYSDATTAFITALLPMARRKLVSVAIQVAGQPSLLSHLVHEVISFDTTLRESFAYCPASPSISWRGLASYMLYTCGYFQPWLIAERDFALSRYRSIIEDRSAGELDYDSVSADATKPTKAAIRVNDLLETITDRYRLLASFSQKLRFLIDIQIAIFDEYHQHLQSGLEAYLTLTSSIGRRVQGVSREEQTELQGVKGLDRLCRIFGSADYLERAMRDWSDDVFFLELWEELQLRAQGGSHIGRHVGDVQEIQRKTSVAVGMQGDEDNDESQGALFDETAAAYHRLRVRTEDIIVETLTYGMREALRSYARVATWASLASTTGAVAHSAELDPTLRLLQDFLGFLGRALGRGALRRMLRPVCHAMQTYIWDQVLSRHSFSTVGAAQFSTDMTALAAQIDAFAGPEQARAGLRRVLDGATLLGLPIKGAKGQSTATTARDDAKPEKDDDVEAWLDDGNDDEEISSSEQTSDGAVDGSSLGLFEVERLVFKDNESARRALHQLGLDSLSESEARAVLERRVEIGS